MKTTYFQGNICITCGRPRRDHTPSKRSLCPRLRTGSKKTPHVQFRVGAEERRRAEELATSRGTTVNGLAHAALMRELGQPTPGSAPSSSS